MGDSPSEPRVKRQRVDKAGRFAALARLKSLKGQKHKCEVGEEVDNVYDVVDEKEFSKRIKEKFGEDWIEDDGTGYCEDGRDLFEDEDGYSDDESKHKSNKNSKKRPRETEAVKSKNSIKKLFSNAVPKKKESEVKLAEDDVLADILGELDTNKQNISGLQSMEGQQNKNTVLSSSRKTDKNDAIMAKQYMQNFLSSMKKKEEPAKANGDSSDDEIIDRILKPQTKSNIKQQIPPQIEAEPPIENIKEVSKNENVKQLPVHSPKKTLAESPKKLHNKDLKNNVVEEDENYEDMDLSILNDNENQFSEEMLQETNIQVPSKVSKTKAIEYDSEQLLDNWENICQMDNFEEEVLSNCQAEEQSLSDNNLKMWYWDAWEDPIKRPGQVFLFGKIQGKKGEYKSVCVHIENIEKILYFLPREYMLDPITKEPTDRKVTFEDIHKEFHDVISNDIGVDVFRLRVVRKKFAFHVPGVDIPQECDYAEIRYNGSKPTPNNKKIYNSIAHIFGTNTTALETFLLSCKIKGPCWLNVKDFKSNKLPLSWCKVEVICSSPKSISVAEEKSNSPPPLNLLTMNVRTALNPKTMKNEVVMISCLVNNKFAVDKPAPNPLFNKHFCGFTRPSVQNWPFDLTLKLSQYKSTKTTKLDTERALLSWFLATYQGIDPDIVVTHDAYDCQLDIICDRIAAIKIPLWSRIGRLRMSQISGKRFKDFFIGRLICDVKKSAEELIRSRSFDLDTLCTEVLRIKEGHRVDVTNDDLYSMYETGDSLLKLITLTMQDCSYILRLMCELNVLPLALQITNICGNLISRTLQGGRSERNEFLLLHAFNEWDYIVPDKKVKETNWDNPEASVQANQTTAAKKKAAYSGGLVLDPIKGFYDKYILLMDFNSLYPSIIQEYNICYTTITEPDNETELPDLPDSSVKQGVLPQQIRRLVESRREVKKLMANPDIEPDLRMQYNIRQQALKLTANSMYGCLGFSLSRFFAQHLAALVTFKGREILMNTKSLVQKLNLDVIYGDTDSIMINTNCTDYDQVFKIGHSVKQTVNKIYKQIELDVDGVFKCLLLLKKKKYAAVIVTKNKKGELIEKQEHKGLDIVRRDWSQISVLIGRKVLDHILLEKQHEDKIEKIHSTLEKVKQDILKGTVPLPLLLITKQLTKAPKDYVSTSTLPHVQVAIRMNATKNKRFKKGDMISYIICDDGTESPAMQRAYHLEEVRTNEKLKVDNTYYLAQQIHPVVSRLCEPLEGTDGSKIAESLGLDPNKFKVAAQKIQRERMDEGAGISLTKSSLQKFRFCDKFKFTCISCNTQNVVASAFKPIERTHIPVLQKCSNTECTSAPYKYIISIRNQLVLAMRDCIKRFYANWLVCDDPACNRNTRILSHVTINNKPVCLGCKKGVLIRQYTERDLYNQLCYYQYMFDLTKQDQKNVTVSAEIEMAYNYLKESVDQVLENSGYCVVSLANIFSNLTPAAMKDQLPDDHRRINV